jgi:hypothetical protein
LKPGVDGSAGEECALVLKGRVVITVGDVDYELNQGDSIYCDSGLAHKARALGDEPAEIVSRSLPRTSDRDPGQSIELATNRDAASPDRSPSHSFVFVIHFVGGPSHGSIVRQPPSDPEITVFLDGQVREIGVPGAALPIVPKLERNVSQLV